MTKKYDEPQSPCDRLLKCPKVSVKTKQELKAKRKELDPIELAKSVEEKLQIIHEIIELTEAQRDEENRWLSEPPYQRVRWHGLRCGSSRYRSLHLHSVRASGKPCQINPK